MNGLTAAVGVLVCTGVFLAAASAYARSPDTVEYRILATKKTSTLQKEPAEAGAMGFAFVGLTVAETAVGGTEVVAIMRRQRAK